MPIIGLVKALNVIGADVDPKIIVGFGGDPCDPSNELILGYETGSGYFGSLKEDGYFHAIDPHMWRYGDDTMHCIGHMVTKYREMLHIVVIKTVAG